MSNKEFLFQNLKLPDYKRISLRNSCDRFGFSHLIAGFFGYSYVPRCFCIWDHGWWFYNGLENYYIGYDRKKIIVVASQRDKIELERMKFENVVAAGLPFSYVPPQRITPIENSLLVFIQHSTESYSHHDTSFDGYLDYLKSIDNDYDYICISLFYNDYFSEKKDKVIQNGFIPISGARADDKYSLIRIRRLLECFQTVTSNTMGSHIAYALHVGCRVSLTGDVQHKPFFSNIQDLEDRYSWLIKSHPNNGINDSKIGSEFIGSMYKLSWKEIKHIFGWSIKGQLIGYQEGLINRINRQTIQ